jgi:L-threonylcarbamoyladenylate synthase
LNGLTGRIDAVMDAGACAVGLESTILGVSSDVELLRVGGIATEDIEAVLGHALARPETTAPLTAPGQMASHYAPNAKIRFNAHDLRKGEILLGFGNVDCALNLSPSGDLTKAAARLFDHLHTLDARGVNTIAVSPIPESGLGRAINDRLRRAAAPRP